MSDTTARIDAVPRRSARPTSTPIPCSPRTPSGASLQLEPGVAAVHAALAEVLTRLNRLRRGRDAPARARSRWIRSRSRRWRCRWSCSSPKGSCPRRSRGSSPPPRNGASARIITSFGDLLARLGLREEAAARYHEALRCGGTSEAHANLGPPRRRRGTLRGGAWPASIGRSSSTRCRPRCGSTGRTCWSSWAGSTTPPAQFSVLTDDPDVAGAAWWGLAAINDARGDCDVAMAARLRAVQTDPELARRCDTAPVGA